MGKQSRERRAAVIAKEAEPHRQGPTRSFRLLQCGKCKVIMPEYVATEHLKECQPAGVKCGHCQATISPDAFLDHFVNCKPQPPAISGVKLQGHHTPGGVIITPKDQR